jgi:hypothetical protein
LWNTTWGGTSDDGGYGVAVGSDVYLVGSTDYFGAGYMDAFLVRYGLPVGGVVLSTSPVESLLYVVIALSIVALLIVAKIRRKTFRFFFSL